MKDRGQLNILFISHRLPFPPNKGDKIRAFNILSHLAKSGSVHLAALIDDSADMAYLDQLKTRTKSLSVARIDGKSRAWSAIKALATFSSISQKHFYSGELQRKIDSLIDDQDFDVIFCSSSPTAEYLFRSSKQEKLSKQCIRIMDFIDIDSVKWQQYADSGSVFLSMVYSWEAKRLASFESRIGEEFESLLVVSEREASYFPSQKSMHKMQALGNGVDLDFFSPDQGGHVDRNTLVFVGMMDYRPNIDGMQWFLDKVFPSIRAEIPDCRVTVVGGKPTEQVRRWADIDGVEVTGFVDDVRSYVHRGALSIVPLLIARGIQNKVLESMAMGKAIIATPEAIEGIDADPASEVVTAATAEDFADAVVRLLNDPGLATRMGVAARARMESEYSWDRRLHVLDEILDRGLGQRESRSSRSKGKRCA